MKNPLIKLVLCGALSCIFQSHAEKLPFEGLFGQIGVGYDMTSPTISGTTQVGGANILGDYNIGKSYSFAESLSIGYNYVIAPKIRLGIGFEYNIMIASPRQDVTLNSSGTTNILGQYLKKNAYNFSVAPGYLLNNNGMAYAKAGFSYARGDFIGDTINFKGYTLGLGYKHLIDSQIYLFGEVNYSDYGNQPSAPTAYLPNNTANLNVNYSNTSTMIMVGYGMRF